MPRRKPYATIEDHPKRTEICDKLLLMLRQRDYGVHPGEERVTLRAISSEYRIHYRKLGAYANGPLQEVLEAIRNGAVASNLHYDLLALLKRGMQQIHQSLDDAGEIPSVAQHAKKPAERAKVEQQEHLLRMQERERVLTTLLFPLPEKAGQLVGPMQDKTGEGGAKPTTVNQFVIGGQSPQTPPPVTALPALPSKTAEAAPVGE